MNRVFTSFPSTSLASLVLLSLQQLTTKFMTYSLLNMIVIHTHTCILLLLIIFVFRLITWYWIPSEWIHHQSKMLLLLSAANKCQGWSLVKSPSSRLACLLLLSLCWSCFSVPSVEVSQGQLLCHIQTIGGQRASGLLAF